MIPISQPHIGKEEIDAVIKVLRSSHLTQGDVVAKFEKKFAQYCSTQYAIATNNGTSALHTALYAVGIQSGDEVITTPYTFVATANAILMAGGCPVFADIDSRTFNINPDSIEKCMSKKTKAILVVNLFGQPADYGAILKIAKKNKLVVIEDAAQSVGAEFLGKKSGNLADISCFSFYATKNIMCGEGGMITTNNEDYVSRCIKFRNHGQNTIQYHYSNLGYNYRLTDILASIGLVQLKKVDKITEKRRYLAKLYTESLANFTDVHTPYVDKSCTHVYHQYTIVLSSSHMRDAIRNALSRKEINAKIFYPSPLYSFNHLSKGKRLSQYKGIESIIHSTLSLPLYYDLQPVQVNKAIEIVSKTLRS